MDHSSSPLLLTRFRNFSRVASAVAVLLGGLALLGWLLGAETLKSIIPGGPPMNPAAALVFIIAGVSLALRTPEQAGPAARRLGQACAAAVTLAGLLKLSHYLLGWGLGLDRVLFHQVLGGNRMAPNTALDFALVGCALLLLDVETRRGRRPAEVFALLAVLVSSMALVGYAYGASRLTGIARYIPMALNTALGLTALAVGVLAARPGVGWMSLVTSTGTGGFLVRRLLPATIGFPALLGWLRLLGQHADFYDTRFGAAIFAVVSVAFFTAVVLAAGSALDRADAERQRAGQELERERYLLHALLGHIPDSIYFKDTASRFTRINQALATRLGLRDPAEAVGKTDFDYFSEEHARPAFEDEQALLRTGQPLVGKEEKETWADGRVRWVLTTKLPLPDRDGHTVGTFGISRDITERKRDQEAVREAEERLRLLLESTGEGIYGIDLQGRCTFINPAAAALLGHRPEDVLGRDIHALIHHHRPDGSPYPADECPIVRTFRTGQSCRVDHEVFWRSDGSPCPVEYAAYPLRARGEIRGAVATFLDITERSKLRSLLVRSEKLASIGLLSAGIAHEINNPLAYVANNLVVLERDFKGLLAILDVYEGARDRLAEVAPEAAGRVQALAEEQDLPYVRDNLERVLARTREGVQRVTRIVQSLRSLARTDRPQLEEVALPQLVEMSLEMIRGRLKRRGIQVELDLGSVPRLRCVSTQLGQVLLNLLTNALQALESAGRAEGGRIRIAGRREGDAVVLEVADNGCGIDPQELPKIFDPFYTTKPVGEGTGLGLAITHGIVTGHGGRIEVESHPGEGTCFRLRLPVDPERGAA